MLKSISLILILCLLFLTISLSIDTDWVSVRFYVIIFSGLSVLSLWIWVISSFFLTQISIMNWTYSKHSAVSYFINNIINGFLLLWVGYLLFSDGRIQILFDWEWITHSWSLTSGLGSLLIYLFLLLTFIFELPKNWKQEYFYKVWAVLLMKPM